jgi:hypothetical protein
MIGATGLHIQSFLFCVKADTPLTRLAGERQPFGACRLSQAQLRGP